MTTNVTLNDSVWKKIREAVEELSSGRVRVGIFGAKGGSDVDGDSGLSVVEIAAVHEFGSEKAGVPERSFIRRTFTESEGEAELATVTEKLAAKVVAGKMPAQQALEVLGTWGAQAVKNRVTQHVIPPPNAPSTVTAKGSSRPLVDTGRMINAVTHVVVGSGT